MKYILLLAIVGVIFAVIFASAEKFVVKRVTDTKKRKYVKIAVYAVLYFIMAIIVDEVYIACK